MPSTPIACYQDERVRLVGPPLPQSHALFASHGDSDFGGNYLSVGQAAASVATRRLEHGNARDVTLETDGFINADGGPVSRLQLEATAHRTDIKPELNQA